MKHLILIAALIAAPAFANSAKRGAANAEICGATANLAVVVATASSAKLSFKEVKPAKTGDGFVDSMVIAVISDAYYGYAAMEPSMVRSLSYSRCQIIMLGYR
jgi:microcompartment protein CcmK/EutM